MDEAMLRWSRTSFSVRENYAHWKWRRVFGVYMLTTVNSLFGFLLGATTAGAGMYYYVIDEYRVSNELLTEDIYVRSMFRRTW